VLPQATDRDHGGQETASEESEKLSIDRRIARYTLWLACFTAVLAISTIGLWIATARTLRHSREMAERQLRAYVNVDPLGINPFSPGNFIVGHVAFHNTGQTWAKNVSMFVDIQHNFSSRLEEASFPIGAFTGKGIIGPRAKRPTGTRSIPVPKNEGWLYVWGAVRYDDGYTKNRVTRFCHRYPCEKLSRTPEGGSIIDVEPARYHENSNDGD